MLQNTKRKEATVLPIKIEKDMIQSLAMMVFQPLFHFFAT